jgi:REP element-mobilizing transposase RayT
MTQAPPRHRRSTRLRDYDYTTSGAYFLTVVTQGRAPILGQVIDGEMHVNALGDIVQREWRRSQDLRPEIELAEFVVMPNHLHGVVLLRDDVPSALLTSTPSQTGLGRPPRSISSFVAGFKATTTRLINDTRSSSGTKVWQRNYHDRVIRNEREYDAIRKYIVDNPLNWAEDPENPNDRTTAGAQPCAPTTPTNRY